MFLHLSVFSFAQEITEENYLKLDEELWEQYTMDMGKISECLKKCPEKRDSLIKVANAVLNLVLKENCELAIRFASVPSGLQRLFMVRLDVSKDTFQSILSGLPNDLKDSPYHKSILSHIHSEQIKEGDKYYDFEAVTSEGEKFVLSSLEGKNILLLYGGLDCMGAEGRAYLDSLYRETSRHDFEIVIYCRDSSLESLKEMRSIYPCDYLLVSDFLQDHTPVKILYGAQSTPTCFFINKQGIVEMKTLGLSPERVNERVYQNK
jgi:peroxiredoxin